MKFLAIFMEQSLARNDAKSIFKLRISKHINYNILAVLACFLWPSNNLRAYYTIFIWQATGGLNTISAFLKLPFCFECLILVFTDEMWSSYNYMYPDYMHSAPKI